MEGVETAANGGDPDIADTALSRANAGVASVPLEAGSIEVLIETFNGAARRRAIGGEGRRIALRSERPMIINL